VFALAVMSITWMALIAPLITLERRSPGAGQRLGATAGVLVALATTVVPMPTDVPGLAGDPERGHNTACTR
jgi:predicted metal-binding membrane protein